MPNSREHPKDNWFQKNPKKTLGCITLLFLLAIVWGAEEFLAFTNRRNGIFLEAERRYIRIKEYRQGTRMLVTFPKRHLPYTDNVFTKKYRLDIDGNGFIKPSAKYPRPDYSIVFLGGSTTECMYVDEDRRFPYVVGEILEQETGKKINSYNGGMAGNNALHAIDILVNKVIPLEPQIVVYMENINDLSTLVYEGTYWNQNTSRSPLETLKKRKLVGKLLKEIFIPNLNKAYKDFNAAVFRAPEDEFAHARGKKITIDKAKIMNEFSMNLQTLICICQAHGIVPVLMTQANRITANPDPVVAAYVGRYGDDTGISYPAFKDLYDAFNGAIREAGKRNNVMVIDLAAGVPPHKDYLYDMVHFNDRGSQYAAEIIAARLKGLISH